MMKQTQRVFAVYFRLYRRIATRYQSISSYFLFAQYRLWRRIRFRYIRLLIFAVWRLWIQDVQGFENLSFEKPVIFVSNHLSYFDFWILSAILKKNTVFVAIHNLDKRKLVGWTMRLNTIIYIDRDKPSYSALRDLMWYLKKQHRSVVIYPEGTRSRTGKMLAPKSGFVRLALKTGVSVVPIVMKGTFEILPPNEHIPKLRKCNVTILPPIHPGEFKKYLMLHNPSSAYDGDFYDQAQVQDIAFAIMEEIRKISGQEWDESVSNSKTRFSQNHFQFT